MNAPRYPLTLYYDAACPLCAEEMRALSAYDGEGRLRLVDCSARDFHDEAAAAAGITASRLMREIHACDAAGHWYRGIDVFVLAYRAAGIEAVARLFAHARLNPLWRRLYPWIARHRMRLSRLHIDAGFGWLVRRAARRARRRTETCADGRGRH